MRIPGLFHGSKEKAHETRTLTMAPHVPPRTADSVSGCNINLPTVPWYASFVSGTCRVLDNILVPPSLGQIREFDPFYILSKPADGT